LGLRIYPEMKKADRAVVRGPTTEKKIGREK
jgi:hypothetical protein